MEFRAAWAGLAFCIAGVALAIVVPTANPVLDLERAEGIDLPVIATVGDYPPPDRRVVVNVDREGRMTFMGREESIESLIPMLFPAAGAHRDPIGTSQVTAVLRVDRATPWRACAWLMQACADPKLKIDKGAFAVLPEDGGEEGAIHWILPKDMGHDACAADGDTAAVLHVRIVATEAALDPEALVYALGVAGPTVVGSIPEIEAEVDVPTGYVLSVLDALYRSGARSAFFVGVRSPKPSEAGRTAPAPACPPKWGIRLDGKLVEAPDGGAPHRPRFARVRGMEIGFLNVADGRVIEPVLKRDEVEQAPLATPTR